MPGCAVYGCANYNKKTKGSTVKYFTFPKDIEMANKWLARCHRKDDVNLKNATVCSVHFDESCFQIPLYQKLLDYTPKRARNLKADAVPMLHLPILSAKRKVDNDRSQRVLKRARHTDVLKSAEKTEAGPNDFNVESEIGNDTNSNADDVVELRKKIAALEDENKSLKKDVKYLTSENQIIQQRLEEQKQMLPESIRAALEKVFTPGQIKVLLKPLKKNIKWTGEDIAAAISLRSVSPKAYRYLRKNNFPLPALSTLRAWAAKLSLDPGLPHDVVGLMKSKAQTLTTLERLTVLSFDEIYISNKIEIDKKQQQKVGPHRCCQAIMARGLTGNWKQPIYYTYDQNITKEIILNVISELYKAGFIVVSITSDMGSGNLGLWSELKIRHDQSCSFIHPCGSNLKIFVFADIPHLLKLLRNHILDDGFKIDDETIIEKSCFEFLLTLLNSELNIAFKISRYHLDLKGTERQKVRPAAQLLSNTIAKAIEYCGLRGNVPNLNWKKISEFIKLTNDWFDLFNARRKYGSHKGCNAFGTDATLQSALLDQMSKAVSASIVGKHKRLIKFQKGILLSNKSLKGMYNYLHDKYDLKCLLTYRLNQDILENFFSYIRGMGAQSDHPTALDIKYRLRWYILGKHSAAVFTANKNTVDDNEATCLINPMLEEKCFPSSHNPQGNTSSDQSCPNVVNRISTDDMEALADDSFIVMDLSNVQMTTEMEHVLESFENEEFKEHINKESLKYIAGYVAHRFRHKYKDLGVATRQIMTAAENIPDWLQLISRGNLLYPNEELMKVTHAMNDIFLKWHKNSLADEKGLFDELVNKTVQQLSTNMPREVLHCLARTRTYIRLRDLNKKIRLE